MCTLTILRDNDRVLVTMNRDDSAAREEAPPALWPKAQPAFVAPRDLQAGGTWIGVNHHGVIACLLNRYDVAPVGLASRGSIVLAAMNGSSIDAASDALTTLDHVAYSPFTCLLISEHGVRRLDWTGSSFTLTEPPATDEIVMLTSSSWQFDEVKQQRETQLREIWSAPGDAADKVATFHSQRVATQDAWAPMMKRAHSETKSVTQVELTSRRVVMRYWRRGAAIDRQLTSPETSITLECNRR